MGARLYVACLLYVCMHVSHRRIWCVYLRIWCICRYMRVSYLMYVYIISDARMHRIVSYLVYDLYVTVACLYVSYLMNVQMYVCMYCIWCMHVCIASVLHVILHACVQHILCIHERILCEYMYHIYVCIVCIACMCVSYLVLAASLLLVSVLLSYCMLALTNASFLLCPYSALMHFAGPVFHASAFRMHLYVC